MKLIKGDTAYLVSPYRPFDYAGNCITCGRWIRAHNNRFDKSNKNRYYGLGQLVFYINDADTQTLASATVHLQHRNLDCKTFWYCWCANHDLMSYARKFNIGAACANCGKKRPSNVA